MDDHELLSGRILEAHEVRRRVRDMVDDAKRNVDASRRPEANAALAALHAVRVSADARLRELMVAFLDAWPEREPELLELLSAQTRRHNGVDDACGPRF